MPAPPTVEERLIELESRAMMQEDLLQKLNEVVIEQQALIERLRKDLEALREAVRDEAEPEAPADERPPHY